MTRDDPRREIRDLWRAIAKLRDARGDAAGAARARVSARISGTGVRQLGSFGHRYIRSDESGRFRRQA